MLLITGHSDFSHRMTMICQMGQYEAILPDVMSGNRIQNVFLLRETVRFCAHLMTGISKHVNFFCGRKLHGKLCNRSVILKVVSFSERFYE